MEKVETKYREAEDRKPLTIDFSSEIARLMKLGTIPRGNPQISNLLSAKSEPVQTPPIDSQQRFTKVRKEKLVRSLGLRRSKILKWSRFRRVSVPSFAFSTQIKTVTRAALSNLGYSVKEIPKIPRESVKVLDEFSYLPMWFTMPVIFASSVLVGAVLSVFVGL
jgi:hypothetical protein